ncbi:DNA polymerase subunit gamma-1, mitochondrial [Coccinella septempunctata]|uniref:DNA polymerase subunit gamma-1, mitochondrial n=1 Tax=Coccinella septempunctata TaxID=41139 RepID=UPI001D09671F|nr:DNA polymerase subunit gamma-1, mitochondrial [Coccinella septempunctata]
MDKKILKRSFSLTNNLKNTVRKVYLPNPNKKRLVVSKVPKCPSTETFRGPRINKLGIQMLSQPIHDQLFKKNQADNCDPITLERCRANLSKFELGLKENKIVPDVDFKIPPLRGESLLEHFQLIAEEQSDPYKNLIVKLLKNIPPIPKKWILQEGWTRYSPDSEPQSVPYPSEEAIVFDVEVCMMCGKAPTLATAVSSEAWYAWVSKSLIDGSSEPVVPKHYTSDHMIPLESTKEDISHRKGRLNFKEFLRKPKIVVGHNVSYDRARIKEQYWLERTGTRFLDTMSLHIAVSGVTSYQRILLKSNKTEEEDEGWKNVSALNNLADVYKLYCDKKLSKQTRDIFVVGTLNDIKADFQKVMNYCCNDVIATYEVLQKLYPMFLERFPHPATFAGMLELSTAYLPINENWDKYIDSSQQSYDDLDIERKIKLTRRADQACSLLHNEDYKKDLWLWDEDWEIKYLKVKKSLDDLKKKKKSNSEDVIPVVENKEKIISEDDEYDPLEAKFRGLWETKENLGKVRPLLAGYPNWYRKLCPKPFSPSSENWVPGPQLISTSMQITPKLLNLTWEGYPLHYLKSKGWGFLVPFNNDTDIDRRLPLEQLLKKCPLLTDKPKRSTAEDNLNAISSKVQEELMRKEFYSRAKQDKTGNLYKGTGIWCNTEVEDCCWFFKLPHKNGPSYNVGNPLSRDFLNKFSENVLAGDTESAEHILAIARMLSYWRNNRDRIMDQMVVWLNQQEIPKKLRKEEAKMGAIIPMVVVCGTLTRRAVESTWMTASNAHPERVGSELRAMVQAPKGYNIVGADVDSQELWIASLMGDASHCKVQGGTPFGWMTLSGNKADGTDMHSVTAKAVGISRDQAKVINYARIYGAGQNFAERLLKQYNPTISDAEAKNKSQRMFSMTKGRRFYTLRKEYAFELPDQPYSKWQAFEIAKSFGKHVDDVFEKPVWVGGTESAMFNRLEQIANEKTPTTPFLNGRLSRSIEPKSLNDDRYLPTRVNWVVQSGAVDFLHLMLVCMRWLLKDRGRFCLSFHDEIRYLVPEEHRYKAALAMHVTNLLTRSFCVQKLGLNDLPQSVAFFSSVEVDTVLRKDAKQDCVTPSNPHGLEKGYEVPNGESLDIYQAVEKACGQYAVWYMEDDELKK